MDMKRIWMKLALAFMAVGASGILMSAVFSIKEMEIHFSMYVDEVREQQHRDLVAAARESYSMDNGWGKSADVQLDAVSRVLGLEVLLYDREQRLIKRYGNHPSFRQADAVEKLPVTLDGHVVGYLGVRRYEESPMRGVEAHFRQAHASAMLWTMLVLLGLVVLVSVSVARTMTRPLVRISRAALDAARGKLSVRVPPVRGNDELADLVGSFNHLIASLERQEELRKRLTSDIAHELRTPLNTLLAQTEGMIDGVWEASPEHLEATRAEVLRLIRLVSDLDQAIRAESGVLEMESRPLDLSDVAETTADSMSAAFAKKGVALEKHLRTRAMIAGDRQRLGQVFANLLSNALKHTPPGGRVSIEVHKSGDDVHAVVKDSGSGISAEDLPHVFERFYRGDRSRNREQGGAGLGLTIVKGIVEAHRGEIRIDSEPGAGTTVTIRFPALPHADRGGDGQDSESNGNGRA